MDFKPARAGASIKPGASAPGQLQFRLTSRASGQHYHSWLDAYRRSRFLSPVPRAFSFSNPLLPGADAPGFMLSPAPQVRLLTHELVTSSMHGKDETRLFRYRFQLLSQVNYVRVDRAGVRIILIAPDCVEQTIARKRFRRMSDKISKQRKFFC